MNSRQMQYAVLLADTLSFSQAAEQLNMTQPALSKQIIHLENELGVKLFDRSTSPIRLTSAGEYFVSRARKMLFEREQLVKTMDQYKSGEKGKLSIGISPFRSLYLMPELVKAVKEQFPSVQIVLSEYGRSQLQKELADGVYDFAIMNLPVDDASFEAIPLEKDTMMLAVPNNLLHLITDSCDADTPIHISQCQDLPFVVLSPGQEMRRLFDNLCKKSDVQPAIHTEVVGVSTAWEMVCAGVAATLIPKQFIRMDGHPPVTLFPFHQDSYDRQPAIVVRRGQYISPFAQFAIDLLQEEHGEK